MRQELFISITNALFLFNVTQGVRLFADPFRQRPLVFKDMVFDEYNFQLALISSLTRNLNNSLSEFFIEILNTAEPAKYLTNRLYLRASL